MSEPNNTRREFLQVGTLGAGAGSGADEAGAGAGAAGGGAETDAAADVDGRAGIGRPPAVLAGAAGKLRGGGAARTGFQLGGLASAS